MKKYKLTEEEKVVVNKFCNFSIPFIFKAGKYCRYMEYFEYVDSEICYKLLKGKCIDEKNYQMIVLKGDNIKREELDNNALEFYDLYLLLKDMVKKYHG